MFGLGVTEILVILVVALIFLGPKRLPDAARSLGRGMAEFRRASSDLRSSLNLDAPDPDPEPPPAKRPVPEPAAQPSTEPAAVAPASPQTPSND